MARPPITELTESEVTPALDRELIHLLSTCFTKPGDEVFRRRRYYIEPPTYRWIMRNAGGDLIAHAAAHDREAVVFPQQPDKGGGEAAGPTDSEQGSKQADGPGRSESGGGPPGGEVPPGARRLRIGGVSEVAVHPAARGMGHAKELLLLAHRSLARKGFRFAALFGRPEIYSSSGYTVVEYPVRYEDPKRGEWRRERFNDRSRECFMVASLTSTSWPEGEVDLQGPKF